MMPADHIESMLLAGAAGDCIGFPREGRPPAAAFELPPDPWRISDDTALTLATCRAIVEHGGVSPVAIAAELGRTFRVEPIAGIGATTLRALRALAEGAHWATAGRPGEFAAGNGAALRIAPLARFVAGEPGDERRLIRDVCRITHKNDEAYVAALAVVRAIHEVAAEAVSPPRLVARLADTLPDTLVRDALHALSELDDDAGARAAADVTGTSGHAPESVPLAIFIGARQRASAEAAIREAVQCGGDCDTIASIAGQIAGAAGARIPPAWLARLPVRDEIGDLAAALARVASPPRRRGGGCRVSGE